MIRLSREGGNPCCNAEHQAPGTGELKASGFRHSVLGIRKLHLNRTPDTEDRIPTAVARSLAPGAWCPMTVAPSPVPC